MNNMIQHNVIQGSPEWSDLRTKYFTASEAPVMMGSHPNMTRDELLTAKVTQTPKEYSRFVEERIFPRGHAVEAAIRPVIEGRIGEDLYPVTGTNGELLASYDGLTLSEEIGFECKQWNTDLVARVTAGDPPAYIYWQLEQQLLVCPTLQGIWLTVTDGTEANTVTMFYKAVPGRREQLLAGWEQFKKDVFEYRPATKTVEAVGMKPADLPALFVEVAGSLTTKSNLEAFRAGAQQLIGSIKTELVTDQDFADADAAIKWLDETEKRIDLVIQQSLSKTGPLDELIRTLKDVQQNLARTTRLKLSKQVEAQKVNRRNAIVAEAEGKFGVFLDGVNSEFRPSGVSVGTVRPDFYAAIKGKRSFDMMVSACNDAMANAKIETNEVAAKFRRNLVTLAAHKEHEFLFPNKQQLVAMEADHLALTIKSKISDYTEQLKRDEAARVQRHKDAIANIEAASQFDDTVPLAALQATRRRIAGINCASLEEFATLAEKAQAVTIAALDARIGAIQQAMVAVLKPEAQPTPEPVQQSVAQKPVDNVAPIKPAPVAQAAAKPARPSDDDIIGTLALHYRVHEAKVIDWLCDMDLDAASKRLEKAI